MIGVSFMSKNRVEVLIGGQVYALQGDESLGHMKAVAKTINTQMLEIKNQGATHHLSSAQLNMLIAINLADEKLKVQKQLSELEQDMADYTKEFDTCLRENLALTERIHEMGLEINTLKTTTNHK